MILTMQIQYVYINICGKQSSRLLLTTKIEVSFVLGTLNNVLLLSDMEIEM